MPALVKRLKLWHRAALVVGVMGAATVVCAALFLQTKNATIDDTAKERMGVAYLEPLRQLRERLPMYRRVAEAGGDATGLAQRRAAVETALARLDEVDRRLGHALGSTEDFVRVRSEWQRYRAASEPRTAREVYARLDQGIRALNLLVGDSSNLILDPALDSYYLMDAVLLTLPRAGGLLNEVIDSAAASAPGATPRSPEAIAALLKETLDNVGTNYRVATEYNPALKAGLEAPWRDYQTSAAASLLALSDTARGDRSAAAAAAAASRARVALEANFKLFDATLPMLDRLLEQRVSQLSASKTPVVLVVVVGLVSGVLLALWTVRSATNTPTTAREADPGPVPAGRPTDPSDHLEKVSEENRRLKFLVAELMLERRSSE